MTTGRMFDNIANAQDYARAYAARKQNELDAHDAQANTIKRIEEICHEFDARVKVVGLAFARLELAKALAEAEPQVNACVFCGHEFVPASSGATADIALLPDSEKDEKR